MADDALTFTPKKENTTLLAVNAAKKKNKQHEHHQKRIQTASLYITCNQLALAEGSQQKR
jgi:hypothetical protein